VEIETGPHYQANLLVVFLLVSHYNRGRGRREGIIPSFGPTYPRIAAAQEAQSGRYDFVRVLRASLAANRGRTARLRSRHCFALGIRSRCLWYGSSVGSMIARTRSTHPNLRFWRHHAGDHRFRLPKHPSASLGNSSYELHQSHRRNFLNRFQARTSSWIARAGAKVAPLIIAHSRYARW